MFYVCLTMKCQNCLIIVFTFRDYCLLLHQIEVKYEKIVSDFVFATVARNGCTDY